MTPNPYIAGFVDGYAVGYVRARLGLPARGDACAACGRPIRPAAYIDELLCHRCGALVVNDPVARHRRAFRDQAASGDRVPLPAVLDDYALARLQEVYAAKRRLPR